MHNHGQENNHSGIQTALQIVTWKKNLDYICKPLKENETNNWFIVLFIKDDKVFHISHI